MHQENNRYSELAQKWLNGTITDEEVREFSAWYDDNDQALDVPSGFAGSEEELRQRILSRIKRSQKQPATIFSLRNISRARLAAASVLIIVSGFSVFHVLNKNRPDIRKKEIVGTTVLKNDSILPGGDRAVLILGDGSTVLLDTAGNGTITENAHTKVIKLNNGQLAFASGPQKDATITYNTLSTPRGGQYALTLADGTKVWLNSASSLRFPTSFGDERIVELTGEAYFEVARHASKPFKVKVNDTEVKVLGTHFNIMAYPDEKAINTTLLEGSVSINKQKETVLLRPGQQAQIKNDGTIGVIRNADVEQAIAWKNGVFNFNGSDIETTMRQIARWYDIEVIYEDKINEHFNGTIPRNASIEKVLQMLEYTGVVRFNMQKRKIYVRS